LSWVKTWTKVQLDRRRALAIVRPEVSLPREWAGDWDSWDAANRGTDSMKWVLVLAALGEAATGLALLLVPPLVGQLLLGMELAGPASTVARVAGIALIALSVACWPGPPRLGMLTYSAGVMLYLAYLGMVGAASGVLLWPAVILHLVLTVLLVRDTGGRIPKD
jgi:hypothetical protein